MFNDYFILFTFLQLFHKRNDLEMNVYKNYIKKLID